MYFARKIFPLVQREVSDVRLLIVGSQPTPAIRALSHDQAITVRADVPSMDDYYRQATTSVVPLRSGGGTRIKILEALVSCL